MSEQNVKFFDAGDKVVVILRMKATGRESGIEVDRDDALVYALDAGKIVSIDYYNSRAQGLEAAGLSAAT